MPARRSDKHSSDDCCDDSAGRRGRRHDDSDSSDGEARPHRHHRESQQPIINVMIQDPHNRQQPSASAAAHSTPLLHHPYQDNPEQHVHHYHHHHHHNKDAPPTYTQPSHSSPPSGGYQTMPVNEGNNNSLISERTSAFLGLLPEEQRRLLPQSWLPESMRGNNGGPPGDGGNWDSCCGHRWPNWVGAIRRKAMAVLGVLVTATCVVIVADAALGSVQNGSLLPPATGPMVWSHVGQCGVKPHRQPKLNSQVNFSQGRNLSIVQDINWSPERQPFVSGELVFKPATGDDKSAGQVEIEIMSNYKHDDVTVASVIHHDEDEQAFTVTAPPAGSWDSSVTALSPCMQMRITVLVPPKGALDTLAVNLTDLDVDILPKVQLGASATTSIHTTVGSVRAAVAAAASKADPYELGSRVIDIWTTSGSVTGWYPLYDLLRIRTVSGNVDVDVDHKPASGSDSESTATLHMSTASGSIKAVAAAWAAFPPRDYVTNLFTNSGSIQATLPFSSLGRFETINGLMNLKLLPVLTHGTKPELTTSSTNGQTNVALQNPLWTGKDADSSSSGLTNLHSDHSTISGGVAIRYPSSWEGTVKAVSISGSQSISGDGLQIYKQGGFVEHVVEGRKGDGDSYVNMHSVSGSQSFYVG